MKKDDNGRQRRRNYLPTIEYVRKQIFTNRLVPGGLNSFGNGVKPLGIEGFTWGENKNNKEW
jgi:hypothetical protein